MKDELIKFYGELVKFVLSTNIQSDKEKLMLIEKRFVENHLMDHESFVNFVKLDKKDRWEFIANEMQKRDIRGENFLLVLEKAGVRNVNENELSVLVRNNVLPKAFMYSPEIVEAFASGNKPLTKIKEDIPEFQKAMEQEKMTSTDLTLEIKESAEETETEENQNKELNPQIKDDLKAVAENKEVVAEVSEKLENLIQESEENQNKELKEEVEEVVSENFEKVKKNELDSNKSSITNNFENLDALENIVTSYNNMKIANMEVSTAYEFVYESIKESIIEGKISPDAYMNLVKNLPELNDVTNALVSEGLCEIKDEYSDLAETTASGADRLEFMLKNIEDKAKVNGADADEIRKNKIDICIKYRKNDLISNDQILQLENKGLITENERENIFKGDSLEQGESFKEDEENLEEKENENLENQNQENESIINENQYDKMLINNEKEERKTLKDSLVNAGEVATIVAAMEASRRNNALRENRNIINNPMASSVLKGGAVISAMSLIDKIGEVDELSFTDLAVGLVVGKTMSEFMMNKQSETDFVMTKRGNNNI